MSEVVDVIKFSGDLKCIRTLVTLRVGKHVVNHGPAHMPTFIWESKHNRKVTINNDMTLPIEVNMSRQGKVVAENETFHSGVWEKLIYNIGLFHVMSQHHVMQAFFFM
jgi:hypothetical protein